MKIKREYEIKNISGQYAIFCNGVRIDSVNMNEISLFLWDLLKNKNMTKTEMLESVLLNFDISTVLALGEIDNFVRTLYEHRMIEK